MTKSHAIPELAGFRAPAPLLVTDVSVLDPASGSVTTHQDILIENGLVAQVGSDLRAEADVLLGAGLLALPGLWDMHVHTFDASTLPTFLARGVTGVRQMAGAPMHTQWRDRLRQTDWLAPRMVFGSPIVDGPRPSRPGSIAVTTPDEGRAAVARCIADGGEFVKVYSQLPADAYAAIAQECVARGIPFAGHVPFEVPIGTAARSGQRSIEHLDGLALATSASEQEIRRELSTLDSRDPAGMFNRLSQLNHRAAMTHDPAPLEALIRVFLDHGTWHVPTLAVLHAKATIGTPAFPLAPYLKDIEPALRPAWERVASWTPDDATKNREQAVFQHSLHLTKELHRAGIPLLAGTDTFVPGHSLHDELALLVRAGLTPLDALRAATSAPARFLGVADRFGAIAPGFNADLLLLHANPLDDITSTRSIHAVVLGGGPISVE
ncbi:amidohydrolase family protein [Kutzneria kofuensis]|uniref:Imidazolonepropionase-like amidohydrolase n=1 Tax=Kutzneria kofuensis TaxID=103725 RepID=A0A7W9KCE5_9PSEU|nr:amidohydrolase family protein [Kutzneria kofuensis]MBB5890027.1 imidazolonepropionase-like amidohydrolase [Kutzneria kofuensis]